MTWTLTELQTASYFEGGFQEMRVLSDVVEDLYKAGVEEATAVLPADESCVLFWISADLEVI